MSINIITIEINGAPYTGFTQMRVTKSAIDFCGRFSFMTVGGNVKSLNLVSEFPIKVGQTCKINIDNITVINGFVETIDINYRDNNHTIMISGRDKTCDIVDSTLSEFSTFVAPISLESVTRNILKAINIADINVSSNISLAPFQDGELIAGEFGISAFDYLDKFAKKKQVLITTIGSGDILFQQTKNQPKYSTILDLSTGSTAIIKGASIKYDITGRYNKYIIVSQSNDAALDGVQYVEPADASNVNSNIFDKDIRKTRIYAYQSDQSLLDGSQGESVAKWEANFKRSQSFTYDVTVQSFHPADDLNKIWTPNNLVQVIDNFADINAILLISDVSYNLDINTGATTAIRMVVKDAFTLEVNRPERNTESDEIGQQYTEIS